MTDKEGVTVRFNLLSLKHDLERLKGEAISWAEIGRGSDVHPNTLSAMLNNKARRIDLETMERLIAYFNREGLEIGVADLFAVAVKEAA